MTFIEKLFALDRLDGLIHRKATGNRTTLANRLNVKPRTVTNFINHLRDLGAEIEMCPYRQSYVYLNDFRFRLKDIISFQMTENVKGGSLLNFFWESENFLQGEGIILR